MSHLAQLHRLKLCKGLPRIHADTTPEEFFEKIKNDFYGRGAGYPPPPRWVGELYLELHQGSLTSQARIKMQNRQCESRLRGVEALCVYCWRLYFLLQIDEPSGARLRDMTTEIRTLWKDTLLNQFHDVLRKLLLKVIYLIFLICKLKNIFEQREQASPWYMMILIACCQMYWIGVNSCPTSWRLC